MTPDPESVFHLLRDRPGAAWLDAVRETRGWSILAWDPVAVISEGADWPAAGRALRRPRAASDAPFASGVLGYVGYGAGHRVEAVPAEAPSPEPEVWLARYEGALCYRHADGAWTVSGPPAFRAEAEALLAAARPLPPPPRAAPPRARHTVDPARFRDAVRRIRELIADGDCYQVNLTRAVHVEGVTDVWSAYRRLRAGSSAPHAAWIRLDPSLVVLSNSPELLLEVRGDAARSRPIKGTRPRHPDPEVDRALAAALEVSEKDRAELAMIVDLVRNDLGRVAVPGSVHAGPRTLTLHANVHHAGVDVTATLEPGRDAWDALAALFPPGSVTGAPKVRACQRIATLEHAPRGVYCGAIGFVDDSGDAGFSVAIRTAVARGDAVRYHVGGGIVADSDPDDEWWETVHKGRALDAALCGAPDTDVAIRHGSDGAPAAEPRS